MSLENMVVESLMVHYTSVIAPVLPTSADCEMVFIKLGPDRCSYIAPICNDRQDTLLGLQIKLGDGDHQEIMKTRSMAYSSPAPMISTEVGSSTKRKSSDEDVTEDHFSKQRMMLVSPPNSPEFNFEFSGLSDEAENNQECVFVLTDIDIPPEDILPETDSDSSTGAN